MYFIVSFEHGSGTYCANIVEAESKEAAESAYAEYEWAKARHAENDEVNAMRRRGMPFITID